MSRDDALEAIHLAREPWVVFRPWTNAKFLSSLPARIEGSGFCLWGYNRVYRETEALRVVDASNGRVLFDRLRSSQLELFGEELGV